MARAIPTIPRKSATQKRSRAMVETLLGATARVLTREGLRRFTTVRVAEEAGVSVGSLYQYFPNKRAYVAALAERYMDDMIARIATVLDEIAEGVVAVRLDVEDVQDHGQPTFVIDDGVQWHWTEKEAEERNGAVLAALADTLAGR